ncbi:MAG: hypothetical protein EAZ36_03300 [Verrucomicrobia bacterium]|nr:MAG: hypothetical protein EAZ36_03300 [Verrucomicrobiota bacterium]
MPFDAMKFVVGLVLAALATTDGLSSAPATMDVSKRATETSTDEKAVLPENRPLERNEVLMDKRFEGETVPKKEAVVGERRSSISVDERTEKKRFFAPERKAPETVERKDSVWNGKQSRFSTADDAYRSKVADRFQDKISDATPIVGDVKTQVSKRTTFDRVNRFVFRKNADQTVGVSTAGSEAPAADASGFSSPTEAAASSR